MLGDRERLAVVRNSVVPARGLGEHVGEIAERGRNHGIVGLEVLLADLERVLAVLLGLGVPRLLDQQRGHLHVEVGADQLAAAAEALDLGLGLAREVLGLVVASEALAGDPPRPLRAGAACSSSRPASAATAASLNSSSAS